jgi:hypothetical protein
MLKRKAPSTAFKPGHKRIPGSGRAKGTPNKFTRDVKEALLNAFNRAGGEDYLLKLARRERRTFAALLGKLLPTQVTGRDGEPLELLVKRARAGLPKLNDAELKELQRLVVKAGIIVAEDTGAVSLSTSVPD